jgi:hypothetical protein
MGIKLYNRLPLGLRKSEGSKYSNFYIFRQQASLQNVISSEWQQTLPEFNTLQELSTTHFGADCRLPGDQSPSQSACSMASLTPIVPGSANGSIQEEDI